MTAVDTDIDSFIQQQKAKLANERNILNNSDKMNSAEYRRRWKEPQNGPLVGNQRRQWGDRSVKLTPRGKLDTDALIQEVQQENRRQDYTSNGYLLRGQDPPSPRNRAGLNLPTPQLPQGDDGYRRQRQPAPQPSKAQAPVAPRQPANRMPAARLDTDALIREVEREKRLNPTQDNVLVGGGGTSPRANKGLALNIDREAYTRRPPPAAAPSQQQNGQRAAPPGNKRPQPPTKNGLSGPAKLDTDAIIAEVTAEKLAQETRKLRQERQELEASKNQGYQARPLQEQTDEYKASTLGSNQSDAAKLQKIKERNDEYNQFLASKAQAQAQRRTGDGKPQGDGVYATIPGLRYSTSAQKREMQDERNREYNQLLRDKASRGRQTIQPQQPSSPQQQPPAAPKQGWGTPTYEEMLDKKRAQESQYRHANNIGFQGDHNVKETERRISELDREVARKQAVLRGQKQYNGILEDPDWLSPRLVTNQPRNLSEGRRGNQQDGQYFASLPLGANPQDVQARRKEEYKRDLQKQMAEAAYARKAERAQGILVNNNNLGNQLTSPRLLYNDVTPRRRADRELDAYHSKILEGLGKLDEPSGNNLLGRRQPTGDRRNLGGLSLGNPGAGLRQGGAGGDSLLDAGISFDKSVLDGPRLQTLDPPAALQYQPSTYITANTAPAMNNSVDEAYNFYASLNPLDPSLANDLGLFGFASKIKIADGQDGRGGGGGGRGREVPSLDLGGIGGDRSNSRVRFADNSSRKPRSGPAQGMNFGTDDDRKQDQREQQNAYREELERQMQERNQKKQREREERERYERKMEEEARNYDPFGKGGGGAPMRDQHGNVVSDLRQLRNDNQNRGANQFSPRFAPELAYSPDAGRAGNSSRVGNSYRDDLIGPPPVQTTAEGETSYARGGHGIFGMPKTDAEKTQADRYKSELRKQIEEKKLEAMRKKEAQRLEEEREQKILDEQRAKMQMEYEFEQAKVKAKEEEARRKNEEMMRAAEEKKLEIERKRREEDEERLRQQREERERELQAQREAEEAKRGDSPPIPTLASKGQESGAVKEDKRKLDSPPVPATRTKITTPDRQLSRQAEVTNARPQSSDVLNQLANMRAQLQNERKRVQTMLDDQEDEVEIYDPRQVQRPPPGPVINTRPEIDVFDTAVSRNPVAVRRTRTPADTQAAEEFRNLKNKGNTESRKHIRERYPDEPFTDSALEHQQQALIREQEEQLRGGRGARLPDDRRDMRSSSSQLHSNSAFVDVNSVGHFPDDFEDLPKRNDSARHRRRNNRLSSSPRVITPDYNSRATFGSQTSLNVDRLARKNEDRLRRLRELQGDDISLYDPEDVLDRFMTKQAHNRPPSRNTLLDDTWLRAGSKQSKY